jgi:hypothetical protein
MWRGEDQPFTLLVAYMPTDVNSGRIFSAAHLIEGQANQITLVRLSGAPSILQKTSQNNILPVNFGSGQAAGSPRIVAIRHTGTAVTIWDTSTTPILLNAPHNSPANMSNDTQFRLFAAISSTTGLTLNQCAMDFYEIVATNSALPEADIQAAIAQMATKWGITI